VTFEALSDRLRRPPESSIHHAYCRYGGFFLTAEIAVGGSYKPLSVGLGKGLPVPYPRPPQSRVSGGSALDRHGSTVRRRYPGGRAWVNQEEGAKSIAAAAGPVISPLEVNPSLRRDVGIFYRWPRIGRVKPAGRILGDCLFTILQVLARAMLNTRWVL
jgi:hypothetical protein